jgi:hypothetical protein
MSELVDGVQQRLSRVNAIMTMYPDATFEFEPGRLYTADGTTAIDDLDDAVRFSSPETLPGRLIAKVNDGRIIAGELSGLTARPSQAPGTPRHDWRWWTSAARCTTCSTSSTRTGRTCPDSGTKGTMKRTKGRELTTRGHHEQIDGDAGAEVRRAALRRHVVPT